ncbi:threonine synthase [Catenovulum agarivorans DS-2]|uniref:Threonine synthase n=1 Tax=Catenovulum agarivorans DS-2 TaxID=1328313 RepID=W7Q912_9ALTE|nr:threonine synthase [Catenovulum agarivorans]EWH08506.1 threonine synthase [Catenovulum agarivorans DS-2]
MELVNLKDATEVVSFSQAVKQGLGRNQGLFFPKAIPALADVDALLAMPFQQRSVEILNALIGDELGREAVEKLVTNAFQFTAPLAHVKDNVYSLELFHGPTLAFKDFGARFLAQCLAHLTGEGEPITILTATSGDTGAAVAHAFHGLSNINVVILYPKGMVSPLQEKQFSTLGDNILTVEVDGPFDDCQALVKQAFDDKEVREQLHLNSANSINIARLLAQVCYYFEALAQLPAEDRAKAVISVPSGNFGNLAAAMIAKTMGLPIKRFVASTNANDTVPRYLLSGLWEPKKTVATMSNAMDISSPNNWPRIEAMIEQGIVDKALLSAESVDEDYTQIGVKQLNELGYLSEPHAAVAYKALKRQLADDEIGIFLGTAHPAKFKETVENILGTPVALPKALADVANKDVLSDALTADFGKLKEYMFTKLG